jgi:hypothetical protein
MKFLCYTQNNTGGTFLTNENLGRTVIFAIPDDIKTDAEVCGTNWDPLAQRFDQILFDPLDLNDTDCYCCGERWKFTGEFSSWSQAKKQLRGRAVVHTYQPDGSWSVKTKGKTEEPIIFQSDKELREFLYNRRQREAFNSGDTESPYDDEVSTVVMNYSANSVKQTYV